MDTGRVGSWLQILGNIGLIVGLILVGVQINQSNNIAQAEIASQSFSQDTDFWLAQMGENPSVTMAKAAVAPADLTPEEILILVAHTHWRMSRIQRDALMEELGLYSDQKWRMQIPSAAQILGSTPISREHLIEFFEEDQRWWVRELIDQAATQPKGGYQSMVENYLEAARSYATE